MAQYKGCVLIPLDALPTSLSDDDTTVGDPASCRTNIWTFVLTPSYTIKCIIYYMHTFRYGMNNLASKLIKCTFS